LKSTSSAEISAASTTKPTGQFTESVAWKDVGNGWHPIHGCFQGLGYSIEWHDFFAKREIDWAASFHPGCIELCLNLSGNGLVEDSNGRAEFSNNTVGFYRQEKKRLTATRPAGQQHQFLTVEFSPDFLAKHLQGSEELVSPIVRAAIKGEPAPCGPGKITRLTVAQQQIIASLRHPPVYAAAQSIWYQCKALELAVMFLFQPPPEKELFCSRQQRQSQERVEQVIIILKQNLEAPPPLEELGRKIGCSHFYLSRIFSNQMGQTITQYLRQLRMEKAAQLLRSGNHNVTEVALEVGYSSLSHFSQAFHETFGCCPGIYPIPAFAAKVTMNPARKPRE
jgi:AraC-like DNA-binding protein